MSGYLQWQPAYGTAQLVVDPESRRKGIGTALLAALGDRPVHGTWAFGDLPAAVSFADFSPDGAMVVTAGRDSRAKVFPTTLEAFFKKACEALRSQPEDFEEVARVCGSG